MAAGPRVGGIVLHPLKAGGGVSVGEATLGDTGFDLDRAWAVVDADGHRQPKLEYISQRKLPKLATVTPEIDHDAGVLRLSAPGMPSALEVPLDEEAYAGLPEVAVRCSGVSTTDGGGWDLGTCVGRSAGSEAERWFTEYLNMPEVQKSKRPRSRYVLVRSVSASTRAVSSFAGPAQLPSSPFKLAHVRSVDPEDRVRFQDFAPFLLVSRESIADLNRMMGTTRYPINSFRGNVVVEGTEGPWDEETWGEFDVGGVRFRAIKECPRCTVPGRDQTTGEYHFKGGEFDGVKGSLLTAQKTLTAAFPDKAADPTWGTWAGPFFGVYAAADPAARGRVVRVGDPVSVVSRRPGVEGWLLQGFWRQVAAAVALFFVSAACVVLLARLDDDGGSAAAVPAWLKRFDL